MTERLETEPPGHTCTFLRRSFQETLSFNRQKILILNHLIPRFDGKRSFLWHTSGPILPNPLQRECPQTPNVSRFCLSDGTIDPDDISQIKIVERAESGVLAVKEN